jgi:hypothetical protein
VPSGNSLSFLILHSSFSIPNLSSVHPFLPALSLIFLLAADAAMAFLRFSAPGPELIAGADSLRAVVFLSLLIGGGLAFWLRRFGLLFPGWAAILSLLWVAALGAF